MRGDEAAGQFKQTAMQRNTDDNEFPREYVALSDFTGNGRDQVRDRERVTTYAYTIWVGGLEVGWRALSVRFVSRSLISNAGTDCWCTPRSRQTGGGQNAKGSQVMPPPVT